MAIYRIEFETLDPTGKGRECYNRDGEPFVPVEQVPARCWESKAETTDNPWLRLRMLRLWATTGAQYIRNVRCLQMQNEPEWKEIAV